MLATLLLTSLPRVWLTLALRTSSASVLGAAVQCADFPGGPSGKEPACQHREVRGSGSIPGLGRCFGEGNGNPLQYSCLENPMDRGAWQATVHGAAESDMAEAT